MTLMEICEPLFQYVCKLNRLGKASGQMSQRLVREEAKGLLADARAKADKNGLASAFDKIELPLIFFTDFMIRESKLARAWAAEGGYKNIAEERRELGGDQRFWDMLEETLLESGEQATHRLAVYYAMIGLGFTGLYQGEPDYLRRKMREIAARVRGLVEQDQSGRICPDCYENVDTRTLTQPPARSLMGLVVGMIAAALILVVSYVVMFRQTTGEINRTLTQIQAAGKTPAP